MFPFFVFCLLFRESKQVQLGGYGSGEDQGDLRFAKYELCKKLYNVLCEKKKGENALNYDHFWNPTAGTRTRRLLRCGAYPSAAAIC